jgi:hypothetical protein
VWMLIDFERVAGGPRHMRDRSAKFSRAEIYKVILPDSDKRNMARRLSVLDREGYMPIKYFGSAIAKK